ncbi:MAG: electron transport complex protein RnfC [Pseudohongiellaceae bacterium]|jgi:electron transport complex protein RnfC
MNLLARLLLSKDSTAVHKTPGGITPPPFKERSLRSKIMTTPMPEELWLSLKQCDGKSLETLVSVGDLVLKNQLIATPTTGYGIPIHAPTSGQIKEISAKHVVNSFAERQLHIVIAVDGQDKFEPPQAVTQYQSLSASQLIEKLHDLGVSGLGGVDFPPPGKQNLAMQKQMQLLIINACECEPFISADEALVREKADQIVSGAEILQQASNAKKCVVAIANEMTGAIQALKLALANSVIELILIPTKYPAGSEKQIVQAVTGKEVPSGGLPSDINVLVQNVGTAYAAYNAIVIGQPCISRITTLAGTPLKTPKNFEVLLGTPIPFLLELCGNDVQTHKSTIVGGSLMGVTLFDDNVAISRTTNCVIAASPKWFPDLPAELACIRCGDCADVCPAKLLPQQLYAFSRSQDSENLEDQNLSDCIECGACSYVCPSNIPLVQYFRASKATELAQVQQGQLGEHWQERYQYNQYRLKKDKEESKNRKARLTKGRSTKTDAAVFSRNKAKADIAAAVSRVKKRKTESAIKKIQEARDVTGKSQT